MRKAHKPNSTRVKVVCYYSHRLDGTPYTHAEILARQNRKQHDIYDVVPGERGKWITRHDESIKKALRHIQKHQSAIISALIIVNNWQSQTEHTIGMYYKDRGLNFTPPEYTTPDVNGCVYLKKMTSIKVDKMRTEPIPYDPQKENRQNAVTDKSVGAAIDKLIGSAKFNVTVKGA